MHSQQRQQTTQLLKEKGIHRALFTNLNSITWLTGFAPPVETGPIFFAPSPVVWYEDGHFSLFVADNFKDATAEFNDQPDGETVIYTGYTLDQPISARDHLAAALTQRIGSVTSAGVEQGDLPGFLAPLFANAGTITPIDNWLEPLRMVKTEVELAKLKENFALADVGQAAARLSIAVGKREIDVWTDVEAAIRRTNGARVPIGNDCVVGYRQANIGGWPETYEIRANDSLIVDISTIKYGYWSDGCATYYPGEPTDKQKQMHQTCLDALEMATSMVKPGVKANAIDAAVRRHIEESGYPVYPHHTGHGVGVSGHEAPRIVPYNEEVLQAGMVIMIEPGIYLPGETSVRVEDALLVTADGAEVLTKHDKSF